jgi:ribosomal protein S18 acetylase RimI-like enzyme
MQSHFWFVNLVFSSKVLKQCRPALEELMFFNSRQFRVRKGIVHSQEKFGHLRIEDTDGSLSVRVGDCGAQTLFVYDQDRGQNDPIGVVVFLRTCPAELAIVHIAVHPHYALQSQHSGLGLGVTLIEKVKEIASRIAGVRQITLHYRQEIVIKI